MPSPRLSNSPTLIRGLPPLQEPTHLFRVERRSLALAPLLWIGAILIAVPWIVATNEAATLSYPGYDQAAVMAPATTDAGPGESSDAGAVASNDDPDHISMIVHVPAGRWVDTGIDMCGCTHVKLAVSGSWQTPEATTVDADGTPIGQDGAVQTASFTPAGTSAPHPNRDALVRTADYGSLIGKVGSDPAVTIGSSRELDGNQFEDSGTLKIGMNAGRVHSRSSGSGELTLLITGEGATVHAPSYCPSPL